MKNYLFLVFLLPQIVLAEILCPTCKDDVTIDDFSGGLNTAVSLRKIPLTMSPNVRNLLIDEKPGSLIQRKGFIIAGSSMTLRAGNGITGIFPYYSDDGTTKFLVTDSSIVLETSDFKAWVEVGRGFNTSVLLRCVQVRNKMWCANGSDAVFTWDSSTRVTLNGTVGTPNVPKFKYPVYYQERVWGLNTVANGSSLDFNAIISTENRLIAPDDYLAWPADRSGLQINVGQGDGQVGTGLWIQDGLLRIGKQNSIYTIYGTDPYTARKTDSQTGLVSFDSVVTLDGNVYYLGPDGIYENLRRISDAFAPDIETFQKDTTQTLENLWETQADFGRGSFLFGSTATLSGFLVPQAEDFRLNWTGDSEPGGSSITLHGGSTATVWGIRIPTDTVPAPYLGVARRMDFWSAKPLSGSGFKLRITVRNPRTGKESFSETNDFNPGVNTQRRTFLFDDPIVANYETGGEAIFTAEDIANSSFTIKFEKKDLISGATLYLFPSTITGNANIFLSPATTVQFISEVSTLTSVTAWGNLESVRNTNGGTVNYFIRTSTSSVNIATQVWTNITPGVRINAPTINNYVQWASTIASVSTITTTNIDNVTIGHIEGAGSTNRAFAIDWKNRYWLFVATETSGKFSLGYVKARITNPRPDAFVLFDGINIRSLAKDRANTLYAGAASTGTVYRLDYGTNDDGRAIISVYESPGLVFGETYKDKVIQQIYLEGQKEAGATLKFGLSVDGGAYTERAISIDGSGRYTSVLEGLGPSNRGKQIQFSIKNDQLDKGLTFENLTPIYRVEERVK